MYFFQIFEREQKYLSIWLYVFCFTTEKDKSIFSFVEVYIYNYGKHANFYVLLHPT
jgi:hypothetical protein